MGIRRGYFSRPLFLQGIFSLLLGGRFLNRRGYILISPAKRPPWIPTVGFQAKERRDGDDKDPRSAVDILQATSGYRAVAPDLKAYVQGVSRVVVAHKVPLLGEKSPYRGIVAIKSQIFIYQIYKNLALYNNEALIAALLSLQ